MSIFKKMIEKSKERKELEILFTRGNPVYCEVDGGDYIVVVDFERFEGGVSPTFCIEFDNAENCKQFYLESVPVGPSYLGIYLRDNKILIKHNVWHRAYINCKDNKDLAIKIARLFKKQYAECKQSKLDNPKDFGEEINKTGIKF